MKFPAHSNKKGGSWHEEEKEIMKIVKRRNGERGEGEMKEGWGEGGRDGERERRYKYGPVPNYNSRHPQFNKNNSSRMQP